MRVAEIMCHHMQKGLVSAKQFKPCHLRFYNRCLGSNLRMVYDLIRFYSRCLGSNLRLVYKGRECCVPPYRKESLLEQHFDTCGEFFWLGCEEHARLRLPQQPCTYVCVCMYIWDVCMHATFWHPWGVLLAGLWRACPRPSATTMRICTHIWMWVCLYICVRV